MAINIKNPLADASARRLAALTGEKLGDAVHLAIEQRLERETRRRGRKSSAERLRTIVERYAAKPVVDRREPDEIIGYDERGLP